MGSSGIGLAASKLFSSHGAFVTIADLSPPSEPVLNPTFARCDVTSWETILAAFEILVQKHRTVDVLIANASVGEVEDFFLDVLDDEGKLKQPKYTVLDINLKGVLDCVKVAIHYMRQQERRGAIVMRASTVRLRWRERTPHLLSSQTWGNYIPYEYDPSLEDEMICSC